MLALELCALRKSEVPELENYMVAAFETMEIEMLKSVTAVFRWIILVLYGH